jgi:hypothetical protein
MYITPIVLLFLWSDVFDVMFRRGENRALNAGKIQIRNEALKGIIVIRC